MGLSQLNIHRYISNVFKVPTNTINISERVKICTITFKTQVDLLPDFKTFVEVTKQINYRDIFSISIVDPDDNELNWKTNVPLDNDKYLSFSNYLDPSDLLTIKIQIEKNIIDGRMSIYNYQSFCADMINNSLYKFMDIISRLLNDLEHLVFEVMDEDIYWCTRSITFSHKIDIIQNNNCFNRMERMALCHTSSYFNSSNNIKLIPEDFFIITNCKNNPFTLIFSKIVTILSVCYISTLATLDENKLMVQISGQRNLSFNYQINEIEYNNSVFKIYNWSYTDGNSIDKLIIVRNIISLHCKYSNLLEVDDGTISSIQSNYNLYLKDNVNQYLNLKKELSTFIRDIVAQIGDYSTLILNKFKGNLIAIFGFLFTVVITKIGTTQKWNDVFTKDTLYIIEIVLIGSFVYLILCFVEARYKTKKILQSFTLIENNYKNVLSDKEIEESLCVIDISKIYNNVKRSMITWSFVWGIILISCIIIIELFTENSGVICWLISKVQQFYKDYLAK